jgi:alkylation response protein AidB-like acyl-CoA dehydrogenase
LQRVRTVCADIVAPRTEEWDRQAAWPDAALRALQAAGLGGLVAPIDYGGMGGGLHLLTQVCEVLGDVDASVALCFGMHSVGVACLAAKPSADQVERFLRPVCEGRHLTTLALSEPGTGSHFYLPLTRMELGDGGKSYAVSGTKCFVTNGGHADSYVLSAVADEPSAPPGHFSLVMVPAESAGLSWGPPWGGWGMRANSSRSAELQRVEVPVKNRLGEEGDQIWYVFNVVAPYFLVAMAGTYLGIASRAVKEATAHLKQRRYSHSGRALAEVDLLQHRLGTLWSHLQRSRRLCYWAAEEADGGRPEALPALCAAKADVGQTVVDVVNDCMTLLGGMAYRDGSVLERLLRDARAAHVMSPTTDLLYTWAGRALLDLPLLGG